MKKFLNKQREMIAFFAYFAIIAVLIYFVILPLFSRINNINDQIQQEVMKQESVRLHIAELPKIQKQYQTLQESRDLSSMLLDKDKAVVLIENLEKMADSTNNKITISVQDSALAAKKVAPQATTANTIIAALPDSNYLQIKIVLNGSYGDIEKFIALLENFEYYADITSVQIGKEDASPASSSSTTGDMFNSAKSSSVNTVKIGDNSKDAVTATLDTVFYTK